MRIKKYRTPLKNIYGIQTCQFKNTFQNSRMPASFPAILKIKDERTRTVTIKVRVNWICVSCPRVAEGKVNN